MVEGLIVGIISDYQDVLHELEQFAGDGVHHAPLGIAFGNIVELTMIGMLLRAGGCFRKHAPWP